jgi:hypothetical protein
LSPKIIRWRFLLVIAVVVGISVAGLSSILFFQYSIKTSTTSTLPSGPYLPNVFVLCDRGTYLADHRCLAQCPNGYKPVNMTNDQAMYEDSSPVCMANSQPVSIYDLAGLQISADNGSTVYLVISNIPMDKVDIMGENYNTNIWLPVSITVLGNLTTSSAVPKVTTEVATLGDEVSTFKILQMNQTSVEGNVTIEYPVCCSYETRSVHIGDDIGVQCLGISEILEIIDYQHQLTVFTRTVSQPPTGGCPI